jgi:hypothetical protein
MTREGVLLIFIGIVIVLGALGVIAWRRRARRDAGFTAPVGEIPAGAVTTSTASGFYVATTRHDQPLERLAIRGLGFRSRVDVTVTDRGIALDLTGQLRLFLPLADLADVDLARVAIDRVVEPGGLVRLGWVAATTDGTREIVDSYLRPQDGTARALADAIAATLPTPASAASTDPSDSAPTTTGTDA